MFTSTPVMSVSQSQSETRAFVGKLYDSVVISGPTVGRGASSRAMEVGTIEEVEDHLMAAELNERNGPARDLQILRLYMEEYQVPQRLAFLCLNSQEMVLQSHQDCAPVILVRYRTTYQTVKIIRQLVMSDVVELLQKCNLHVSLVGSQFDQEVSGNRAGMSKHEEHVEFRILQPTMSSSRMVMGDIVSASNREFIEQVANAVEEVHQAAQAILRQNELVLSDRQLRLQQQEDLWLSEIADKEKTANEKGDQEEEQEKTVIDGEEVRKRRLAALEEHVQARKRQREGDEDSDLEGDESGTVILKSS